MQNAEVWILIDLFDRQLNHVHLYHGNDDILDGSETQLLVRAEKMDGPHLLVGRLVNGSDLLHEILIEFELRLVR